MRRRRTACETRKVDILQSSENTMKSRATFILIAALATTSCGSKPDQPPVTKAEQPFAAGGSIEMQLEGGDYTIRASSDDRIRVSFAGATGNAVAKVTADGSHAKLTIKDTPHNNFRATVEVPATADLTVRLGGGNLQIAGIAGNKDIDSKAGNVSIAVPNSGDYAAVDAAVTAGNLDAGPFGESGSGLAQQLKWSGPGKYTLRAVLGAGNLELKR